MILENPTIIYSNLNNETNEFEVSYKLMLNKELKPIDIGWGVSHSYASQKRFLYKPKWLFRAPIHIGVFSETIKGKMLGPFPKTIYLGFWVCSLRPHTCSESVMLSIEHTFEKVSI